jgi:hypothetical protein
MHDEILPDFESVIRIDRRYPWLSNEENYHLAQRDVRIRLSGGVLCDDGRTWRFPNGRRKVTSTMIREHNCTSALTVLNCARRWRHLAKQVLQEFGVTREQVQPLVALVAANRTPTNLLDASPQARISSK